MSKFGYRPSRYLNFREGIVEIRTETKSGIDRSGVVFSVDRLQTALLDRFNELRTEAPALHQAFRSARPFPHLVIDDFLPKEVADEVADRFPGPQATLWAKLPTEDQRLKLATTDERTIPPLLRAVLFEMNSGNFLRFLEAMTGIPHLVADTKMVGGGMHQILRDGKLAVHIDYSHHPGNQLFRRLNVLLYLNRDWKPEYGGELQLWDSEIKAPQVRILPLFNRCAVFATSEGSYHGHPEPLSCPPDVTRNSLSLYYFTKNPPDGKEDIVHNTLFKSRPGDRFHLSNFVVRAASSGLMREWMPPVLYRGLKTIWNKRVTST